MLQPDLELYFGLKAKLEAKVAEMGDGNETADVINTHLKKIEYKMQNQFDATVNGAIDDIYYMKEIAKLAE